jgi:hypothetical protein
VRHARERPPELHHQHQTGVAMMPGMGYRVIVPYDEYRDCGDSEGSGKRVCTSRVPFFIDLQFAFGVTPRLEIIMDTRFGVEKEAVAGWGRQFGLMPGVRFWLDEDIQLKFFTTVQFLYDYTQQNQMDIPNSDYGIRNSNGLMYDPIRNVGFYVQFGDSIGFHRWFRMEVDLGFGVQMRFP